MKECFKCKSTLGLEEFYKHPQTKDGYLNKCKECTKKDVANYQKTEAGRVMERKRSQSDRRKTWVSEHQKKMRKINREKYYARNKTVYELKKGNITRQPCEICNDIKSQIHHIDYSQPLKVKWLCFKHHRQEHGQLQEVN